jgi:hypothetical protein
MRPLPHLLHQNLPFMTQFKLLLPLLALSARDALEKSGYQSNGLSQNATGSLGSQLL